jgi:Protein of unknown function (DUF 659)
MPSSKTLSGKLLDQQYDQARMKINSILQESVNLTLTSDGWTNVRGSHIVNFIIKAPSRKPFFFKSINTSGIPQTGKEVAGAIFEVIEEIGVSKLCAVICLEGNRNKISIDRCLWMFCSWR